MTGVPWTDYFLPQAGFIRHTGLGRNAALLGVIRNVKISTEIASEKYLIIQGSSGED